MYTRFLSLYDKGIACHQPYSPSFLMTSLLLLYADDIVLLAEDELNLQRQLDILNNWCNKWMLNFNLTKSEIIHFRKTRKKQTKYIFKFGNNSLTMVLKYKHLSIILDEHLTYNECATTLADSAGRNLGSVISKFYSFKNIGYSTFSKLYDTTVWPILDYYSSIWSFKKHNYAAKVQDRPARYFLGVHKNAPSLAMQGKICWILPEFKYYVSMLHLWNKLISLDPTRITHLIFEWDHQNFNPDSWNGKI